VDLNVYKGDSGSFRITLIPNEDDEIIDLNEAEFDADIRLSAADEETISFFEITVVEDDPTSIDVFLSSDKSETLPEFCVYDVEMRIGDHVSTLVRGTINVTQDVSRPEDL